MALKSGPKRLKGYKVDLTRFRIVAEKEITEEMTNV